MLNRTNADLMLKFQKYSAEDFAISSITVAELEYGVANSERVEQNHRTVIAFLAPLKILPFDQFDARVYATIKKALRVKGEPIDPLDELIAAQAINHNLVLITNDKHFFRIPNLRIENWLKK